MSIENHYYTILKNAPLLVLIAILLFMPVRYALLLMSMIVGRGPSARLKETMEKPGEEKESAAWIILRSWRDVFREFRSLMRKRTYIKRKRSKKRSSWIRTVWNHYSPLHKSLFK